MRAPAPKLENYRIECRGPVSQTLISTIRLESVAKETAHLVRNTLEKYLPGQAVSIYLEPNQGEDHEKP